MWPNPQSSRKENFIFLCSVRLTTFSFFSFYFKVPKRLLTCWAKKENSFMQMMLKKKKKVLKFTLKTLKSLKLFNVLNGNFKKAFAWYCTLSIQGSNFFHGDKFSVQTVSFDNVAYLKWVSDIFFDGHTPNGLNPNFGLVVSALVTKFSDEQNCPDNAWTKPFQFLSTLKKSNISQYSLILQYLTIFLSFFEMKKSFIFWFRFPVR